MTMIVVIIEVLFCLVWHEGLWLLLYLHLLECFLLHVLIH